MRIPHHVLHMDTHLVDLIHIKGIDLAKVAAVVILLKPYQNRSATSQLHTEPFPRTAHLRVSTFV